MKKTLTTLTLALLSHSAWAVQDCDDDFSRSAANTRYSYSEEGTVTDLKTGLTWMRCPVGAAWDKTNQACDDSVTVENTTETWQSALQTAATIRDANGNHALHNFAGKTNWRLPNIKELVSLTEIGCHSPAMNATAFASGYSREVGDLNAYIWSATSAGDGSEVLTFDSFNGEVYGYTTDSKFSVLLVTDE